MDSNELVPQPSRSTGVRFLMMVVISIGHYLTNLLIFAIAVFQLVLVLIGSGANSRLQALGSSLGRYQLQNAQFLTFASEQAPFPFSDWPG